ncbi:MAG: thiolase family protein [Planctomycetes bacterium]|nr:thiolase family protein [Planctomycetota bacterium]
MPSAVIVDARRTPIGKFLGAFSQTSAADLGVAATRAVLAGAAVPADAVEGLIFGCARQAGNGPNIARQISVRSGVPQEAPAFTVNQACASGLQALILAAREIECGAAEILVAGGTENMTRVPFLLDRARLGYRLGHSEMVDGMYRDGFLCPLAGQVMGDTAENLVEKYALPRAEQDAYAVESQRRAGAAIAEGRFKTEIVPVEAPGEKGGATLISADEHPRPGATPEGMAKLPPVFRKNGTIHAGNSSGITDGAAALLLMSEARAASLGLRPMAFFRGSATVGVDPKFMGLGPVPAVRRLEQKIGWPLDRYDLIELNEAFAAQVLACDRELGLDRSRLNVNGGAIALGHPIGCTGARIAVTLLHEMARRGAARGLATLCVSGGLGVAAAFERIA